MYLLFDIGGTKTRMAYSEDGESFGEPVKFETLPDFDAAIDQYFLGGVLLHRVAEAFRFHGLSHEDDFDPPTPEADS